MRLTAVLLALALVVFAAGACVPAGSGLSSSERRELDSLDATETLRTFLTTDRPEVVFHLSGADLRSDYGSPAHAPVWEAAEVAIVERVGTPSLPIPPGGLEFVVTVTFPPSAAELPGPQHLVFVLARDEGGGAWRVHDLGGGP